MPSYIVTAYCESCDVAHPTGVELEWPEQISAKESIAQAFDGIALPPEVAEMSRNYFLCPHTGKMYKQTDNNKLFLEKKPT
jgi:hypothetical protein